MNYPMTVGYGRLRMPGGKMSSLPFFGMTGGPRPGTIGQGVLRPTPMQALLTLALPVGVGIATAYLIPQEPHKVSTLSNVGAFAVGFWGTQLVGTVFAALVTR